MVRKAVNLIKFFALVNKDKKRDSNRCMLVARYINHKSVLKDDNKNQFFLKIEHY